MTSRPPPPSKSLLQAAEREQRKMAEDLHETLCQNLVGVSLLAGILLRHVKTGKKLKIPELENICGLIDKAIDQSRLPFQDQSILLGATDLNAALGKLAHITSKRTGCRYKGKKGLAISSPRVSHALYRIAQESIRNALRHSQAGQITVSLATREKTLLLAIRDDGCGFNPSPATDGFLHGIELMTHYADSMGGTLSIQSKLRKGTVVTCAVPLQRC